MHARFEIWQEPTGKCPSLLWAAQMINYIARFETQVAAENFVASVKAFRKKHGLK